LRCQTPPLLVDVDLAMPAPPGLGGGKHTPTAAHVAEGSLPRPVGSAAWHTGDTRHGAPGSPRLGTALHACLELDGVRLPLVLGQVGVDLREGDRKDVSVCGVGGG